MYAGVVRDGFTMKLGPLPMYVMAAEKNTEPRLTPMTNAMGGQQGGGVGAATVASPAEEIRVGRGVCPSTDDSAPLAK